MNNIKYLRVSCNITQVDLAIKLGISQSTVAMWETGKSSPTADKLPQLAKILGCTIDDLFKSDKEAN